jgi:hypothetical protein
MFSFSDALVFLKEGQQVRRQGWNNPMAQISLRYLTEAGGDTFIYTDMRMIKTDKVTEKGKRYEHAWLASHLDLLAMDWELVKKTTQ